MTLQVIGAGLGRTGTFSLKFALEHLGFGPCYHMSEVLASARRSVPLWLDAVQGKPDWDAIFDGFVSTCDYPGCTYWRELAAHYPQAKIVLTTRDADSWFDSVSATIFSEPHRATFSGGPLAPFFDATVYADFGDRIGDRAFMTDYFRRWNQQVIDAVPPERLLVYSAREGWEPLCAFLGVPVPDMPYPRVNSREELAHGREEAGQQSGENHAPPSAEQLEAFARSYIDQLKAEAFAG